VGVEVEADHISCGIAEPGRHRGRGRADRVHDLASVSDDGIEGRGRALDHDVEEQTRYWGRGPPTTQVPLTSSVGSSNAIERSPGCPSRQPKNLGVGVHGCR
jgi:hypothetical protein